LKGESKISGKSLGRKKGLETTKPGRVNGESGGADHLKQGTVCGKKPKINLIT